MRELFLILASVALTVLCWGMYGPLMHKGQIGMDGSRFRQLICVGVAYFIIAIIVPILWIHFRGDEGQWTFTGTTWSLFAGAAGAFGAVGIILALSFGGKPLYVMPLVFGCAPVVNAVITLYLSGTFRTMPPLRLGGFLAGLLMVSVGAFLVLFTAMRTAAPGAHGPSAAVAHDATTPEAHLEADSATEAASSPGTDP